MNTISVDAAKPVGASLLAMDRKAVPLDLSGRRVLFHRRLVDRIPGVRKQSLHHRLEKAQWQRVVRRVKRRRIIPGTELDGRLVLRMVLELLTQMPIHAQVMEEVIALEYPVLF